MDGGMPTPGVGPTDIHPRPQQRHLAVNEAVFRSCIPTAGRCWRPRVERGGSTQSGPFAPHDRNWPGTCVAPTASSRWRLRPMPGIGRGACLAMWPRRLVNQTPGPCRGRAARARSAAALHRVDERMVGLSIIEAERSNRCAAPRSVRFGAPGRRVGHTGSAGIGAAGPALTRARMSRPAKGRRAHANAAGRAYPSGTRRSPAKDPS